MSTISSISNNQYEKNLNRLDRNGDEPLKNAQPVPAPLSPNSGSVLSGGSEIGSAINQLISTLKSMELGSADAGVQPPSQEMPSIKEMFAEIDKDGDGKLSQAELLADAPEDMSKDEAKDIFSSFDIDANGSVSLEEFSADYYSDEFYLDDQQAAALDMALLDGDASGTVSKTEFLGGRPDNVSEGDAKKLFGEMDRDGNGVITIDEMLASQKKAAEAAPSSPAADEPVGNSASRGPELSLDEIAARLQQIAKAYDGTGGVIPEPARSIIV